MRWGVFKPKCPLEVNRVDFGIFASGLVSGQSQTRL